MGKHDEPRPSPLRDAFLRAGISGFALGAGLTVAYREGERPVETYLQPNAVGSFSIMQQSMSTAGGREQLDGVFATGSIGTVGASVTFGLTGVAATGSTGALGAL